MRNKTYKKVSSKPFTQVNFVELPVYKNDLANALAYRILEYRLSKDGYHPKYVMVNSKDWYQLFNESLNPYSGRSNFMFMGAKLLRSNDISEGEFILSHETN